MMIKLSLSNAAALTVLAAMTTGTASGQLLFHEPFDYGNSYLNGQQPALGASAGWATTDTGEAQGWYNYTEATLTGFTTTGPLPTDTPNVFDGTYGNLSHSGGYAGSAGPAFRTVVPTSTDSGTGNMDASIALDASVTASFQSNTTTWMSYVTARAWDRNEGTPQVMLTNLASSGGGRGLTLDGGGQAAGDGIGGGGGPTRSNLLDLYPQYFEGGVNNHAPGGYDYPEDPGTHNVAAIDRGFGTPGTHDGKQWTFGSGNNGTARGTLLDNHQVPGLITQAESQVYDAVEFTAGGDFGDYQVVVMKIEWDADQGGEDIISLVSFLSTDVIDEAAFDAAIVTQPLMSSANWVGKNEMVTSEVDGLDYLVTYDDNKPQVDQSQLTMINIQSLKFLVDEIRIGQSFDDIVGGGGGSPADFDKDGFVTNADIAIGISNFTGPQTDPPTFTRDDTTGDTDGDGDDDNGDLATVISEFTGPGPAPAPEPTSLALLGLGGLLIARRRRA